MDEKYIKYVAIYLRKSRGDADIDLNKHRNVLIQLCTDNNWKYVLYEEIETGDNIAIRPVFQKLLLDINAGIYDAILVVDIDRLGRGDLEDQGIIKKAICNSNTYVVTPQQIYNLKNDDDEFIIDMKSFIARREYKQIVKRFSQGKKIGARLGMWTNGRPPYPYEYEHWKDKYNPKGLVVNEEKLEIYRYMLDSLVEKGKTPKEISVELNKKGIPSPKHKFWNSLTVYRILKDETHLGKIISNKTKGDGHKKPNSEKFVVLPKDKWVVVEGNHEKLKSEDEHEQILLSFSKIKKTPRRKPNSYNITPLTGIVKCGLCGHSMGFYSSAERKETLKPCWYVNPYGVKCVNKGMVTENIYKYIYNDIIRYKDELINKIKNSNFDNEKEDFESEINSWKEMIDKKQKSLTRIQDAYENGAYSLNQYKERKEKVEKEIISIYEEIKILNIKIRKCNVNNISEKLAKVDKFIKEISNSELSNLEKNELYKTIIDKIEWIRDNNNVTIKTTFK